MKFSFAKVASVLAVVTGAFAGPIVDRRDASLNTSAISPIGFNQWAGLQSLSGFDDFFGVGNFNGLKNAQLLVGQQNLVCQAQQAIVIQQQLSIVQEFAKQIILTQACDVQAQVLFLEQFRGGLRDFRLDLQRVGGRQIGFDANVAVLLQQLVLPGGQLNIKDFGFRGVDIGKHLMVPGGSVWNDDVNRSVQDLLKLVASQRK
ncbi:hypothetical protein BJ165DRAFT_1533047 [Panaeolus papilionaceus]|nr:hypothetical protein BJ165DRAFT_1533047 [Panaeolus papilionaceus]